jgi:hypothetical protein
MGRKRSTKVTSLGKSDLKSFSFSDVKVAFPDKDTALLTNKVAVQRMIDRKDASRAYNAASVWHKGAHGGRWVLHTEVKVE